MIRTQFQNNEFKTYEVDKETITVPDQTLTIKELLDRHSRGLPLGVTQQQGQYFDVEIPQFQDLTEMIDWKKGLMETNKELNALIRQQQKKEQSDLKQPSESEEKNIASNEEDL